MDAAFIWKLSKLGRIGSTRQRYDDDFADRLNYQYTSVLLFLFIGLIGIRQLQQILWAADCGCQSNSVGGNSSL
ncbi:innexin [Echinococcus multilocularis]|uniref:Innexin n=1 Tax=Echinococcus multilocularis TaxID=6211 RepID=A0A0S4MMT9_ECHMU|nr:innexin [Echinococcus multilocularis]